MIICDFGCDKEAIHQFKGSKRWCCSKVPSSCEGMKKKNSAAVSKFINQFENPNDRWKNGHPKGASGKPSWNSGISIDDYPENIREKCREASSKGGKNSTGKGSTPEKEENRKQKIREYALKSNPIPVHNSRLTKVRLDRMNYSYHSHSWNGQRIIDNLEGQNIFPFPENRNFSEFGALDYLIDCAMYQSPWWDLHNGKVPIMFFDNRKNILDDMIIKVSSMTSGFFHVGLIRFSIVVAISDITIMSLIKLYFIEHYIDHTIEYTNNSDACIM